MWDTALQLAHSIQFQHPAWLWTWWPAAAVLAWWAYRHGLRPLGELPEVRGGTSFRHPRSEILRQFQVSQRRVIAGAAALWRWLALAVCLLCFLLALAQPYRLGQQLPTPPAYRDTIFIVDTSLSMVLRDYRVAGEHVDRMTMLKSVLTHFIEQLQGNRIELIVFSEQVHTLVPLTADYALLKSAVHRLEPAVLTGRGSDLGKAMLYTVRRLEQTTVLEPEHKPVLVLLTDVNRAHRDIDPMAVAAYLRDAGYRLHTVGIGASGEGAGASEFAGLLYEPANFALLKSIAQHAGGQFYWADHADSLRSAIEAIQSAERRQIVVQPRYVTIPLYHWPLLVGLAGLVLMQLGARLGRRV